MPESPFPAPANVGARCSVRLVPIAAPKQGGEVLEQFEWGEIDYALTVRLSFGYRELFNSIAAQTIL